MNGKDIVPKSTVKVLGVHLDEHLRMSEHIQKAAQKAKVQAMALSTVRGLRPAAMRQLYMSTVASKLDYAAPVWFQSEKQGSRSHKAFEAIQKIGSRTILGAYKTAAGPILESEAGLLPTTLRLERRVMQYVINLHTLPKEHPWWPLSKWFRKKITRFKSPLVQHLHCFQDATGITEDQRIETIQAFAQHPSTDRKSLRFVTYGDRQIATAEAKKVAPAMYTDGSNRNGVIGIGVVWRARELPALGLQGLIQHCDRGADWIRTWETIDLQANANEYAAELAAILRALQILKVQPGSSNRRATVLTDCLSAIQSIQKPRLQSGQYLLQQIWHTATQLYTQGTRVTLQWVPGHEGIEGNEIAHNCARLATRKRARLAEEGGPRLKSRALQLSRDWIKAERVRRFDKLQVGKFTRKIDKALPNEHMTKVYNSLSREEAGILSQLRTDHTPLNSNLARIGAKESANCICGPIVESTQHFLFHCPKWRSERTKLRETMVGRWGDLAYALGGWSGRRDKRTSKFVDRASEK